MTSATDELRIFQNILAQSEQGLGDPNLIGKFSKMKAMLHRMDSMEVMNSQNNAQITTPQPLQGTISPEMGQSTTQGQNTSIMPQNDINTQNAPMGQGKLQLPQ